MTLVHEMAVTPATIAIAVVGLALAALLFAAQVIAVVRPRALWTVKNIYGGAPEATDPKAYFAFNQGLARADVFFWLPLQFVGSIGMLVGQRWGFVLALIGAVPFWYSAILIYVWDRDLGFRRNTVGYWVTWGMFPAFGAVEMVYCFQRLMG